LLSAEKPYTEQSGWGATFAYTFADAKQNHIHIDDCCAFDEETVKQYPIITSTPWPGIAWWLPDRYAVPGK